MIDSASSLSDAARALQTSMAVSVIDGPFLIINQDLIGLVDLFKLGFGFVGFVDIGVIFLR